MDGNSFSFKPPFLSDSNLHLSSFNSLTVNNYLGVILDIDGGFRSKTNPVVGADENTFFADDAGISGFTSLTKFICEGIYHVNVNLYNYGINELDSVSLDYYKDNLKKRTVKWKGSIKSYSSAIISIGPDTFASTGKTITLKIKARQPNGNPDLNSSNDADSISLTVYPKPQPDFTINDTNQCFNNNSFTFTNKSVIKSGSMSYEWKPGDGTNFSTYNCIHSYLKTGTFQVILKATSDRSCIDTVYHNIHVRISPVVNLGNDTTIFNNQSINLDAGSGYDSYSWSTGSGSQTIKVDSNGSQLKPKKIWVSVMLGGCPGSDTIIISFKIITGIEKGLMNFRIYPNPVQSFLHIETEKLHTFTTVMLLDALGQVVYTTILEPQNGNFVKTIDVSLLAKEIYFVKLVNDYGTKTEMMIKE